MSPLAATPAKDRLAFPFGPSAYCDCQSPITPLPVPRLCLLLQTRSKSHLDVLGARPNALSPSRISVRLLRPSQHEALHSLFLQLTRPKQRLLPPLDNNRFRPTIPTSQACPTFFTRYSLRPRLPSQILCYRCTNTLPLCSVSQSCNLPCATVPFGLHSNDYVKFADAFRKKPSMHVSTDRH